MKTVLFGGTTEGRTLSLELARMGADVTVSVVSEYGARQLGEQEGMVVRTGPMSSDEMADLVMGADLVIDATHPFAVEASSNIIEACRMAGVRRLRLIRDREDPAEGEGEDHPGTILHAKDREEAVRLAVEETGSDEDATGEGKGNVLLTTGVRDLKFYCENLGVTGIYVRVLPSKESIGACLDSGLEPGNIIAMQGPFSVQMNEALIREFDIDILITKESGKAGGFMEKIRACENCGIKAIVISRPEEEGMTYDEVIEECRSRIHRNSFVRTEE